MNAYLTDEEVEHLTGKVRWSAQVRVLVAMGKRLERQPNGKPIVYCDVSANETTKAQPKRDAA